MHWRVDITCTLYPDSAKCGVFENNLVRCMGGCTFHQHNSRRCILQPWRNFNCKTKSRAFASIKLFHLDANGISRAKPLPQDDSMLNSVHSRLINTTRCPRNTSAHSL